jgi:cysteine desulfurase
MAPYLDHNATTPLRPEARSAMATAIALSGNPSSVHRSGQATRLVVEEARVEVARLLDAAPSEVVFTASGTEADNLALRGVLEGRPGSHLVTTGLEHEAVTECARLLERRGHPLTIVPPGPGGRLDPDRVLRAVRPDTALVSVTAASNLLGTLQPVREIAAGCRERGVLCHTDAVQVAGRVTLSFRELGVDMLSVSSHKMGGPMGAGALLVRRGVDLEPLVAGGGQEFRRRSGTEAIPVLAGFGAAAAAARGGFDAWAATGVLRDRLEVAVVAAWPRACVLGAGAPRMPNTSAILLPGHRADDLVVALDLEGFAASAGSACHSGAPRPNGALASLGLAPEEARAVLRLSLGPGNTVDEIDAFVGVLRRVTTRAARAAEVKA